MRFPTRSRSQPKHFERWSVREHGSLRFEVAAPTSGAPGRASVGSQFLKSVRASFAQQNVFKNIFGVVIKNKRVCKQVWHIVDR